MKRHLSSDLAQCYSAGSVERRPARLPKADAAARGSILDCDDYLRDEYTPRWRLRLQSNPWDRTLEANINSSPTAGAVKSFPQIIPAKMPTTANSMYNAIPKLCVRSVLQTMARSQK